MAKSDRFQIVQEEGNGLTNDVRKVLLDTSTGVQYLFVHSGYAGGLCPCWTRTVSPSPGRPEEMRKSPGMSPDFFCPPPRARPASPFRQKLDSLRLKFRQHREIEKKERNPCKGMIQ